jgi:tetratricopeptide (TPR) repeat protein
MRTRFVEMKDEYWTEQVRIQREVATAWVSFAQGQRTQALDALRRAADAEDATDKAAISPGPLAPAREQLGELLLALERPAEALVEFEAVMKKEPRRFRATYGAAKAASLAGDRAKARTLFTELLAIAATADAPGRPELVEARAAAR